MSLSAKKISIHPYVTRKKGVCGGRSIVRGTRIFDENVPEAIAAANFTMSSWLPVVIIAAFSFPSNCPSESS
jgi:hypothetical protein